MPVKIISAKPKAAYSYNQPPEIGDASQYPIIKPLSNKSSVFVTKPFCDKIVLTSTLSISDVVKHAAQNGLAPDDFLKKIGFEVAQSFKKSADLGFKLQFKPTPGYDVGNKRVGPRDAKASFGVSKPNKKSPWSRAFRMVFNPRRLGPNGLEAIESEWNALLCEALPFDLLLARAGVTELHAAVDLINVGFGDLRVRRRQGKASLNPNAKKSGKRTIWLSPSDVGETYSEFSAPPLGRSRVHFCMYDKRQERINAGKAPKYGPLPWTRVERRLEHQKVFLRDLPGLKNPFASTELVFLPNAGAGHDPMWRLFADSAMVRGLEWALSFVPPSDREAWAHALLDAKAADFFPAGELWTHWPAGLAAQGLGAWIERAQNYGLKTKAAA